MPGNTSTIESLTRDEIYQRVWSQPMLPLARSFGIPTAMLAKICRSLKIPLPGKGYWWKKELGFPVEPAPLLPLDAAENKPVEEPARPKKQLTETERRVAVEKKDENRIRVPDQLLSPHPLVERTLRSLSSAKTDLDGRVRPRAKGCLDVCVGPESVDRAMRIMDAFLKAVEARGYTVVASEEKETEAWIKVDDEDIAFSLEELLNRREVELTPVEKRERERYERDGHVQLWWYLHRTEFVRYPNGRFTLTIDNHTSSIRARWSDGSTQRVENRLNSVIASLIRSAEHFKESRRQAEERDRIRKEEERRRLQKERRRREEHWRAKAMESKLAEWQHVEHVRAFVGAVRAEAVRRHGDIQKGTEIARWLAWGERYASRRDPLAADRELPTYSLDEEVRSKLEQSLKSDGFLPS